MTAAKPSYDVGTLDFPLKYTTIGEMLVETARRFPEAEALVSVEQNRRFTYREFDAVTSRLAKGLYKLGIRRGDRVALWSINRWEWTAVQFATAKIGSVVVNINPAYRTHELKYSLEQSQCQSIVLLDGFKSSKYKEMLLEICPELPSSTPGQLESAALPLLKNVVLIGEPSPGMFAFESLLEMGSDMTDDQLTELMGHLDPDDDINIQYTSGTTGFPKGVTLTHFNILNNGYHVAKMMNFNEKDRLCIPVPFYHCFGMVMSNLASVSTGACMVIPGPVFDAAAVLRAVAQEKCTALHGVPTMFIAELNLPNLADYDLSTLRTGIMAGAPCPIETMKEVISKMNMSEVVIAYGQTESSPVCTMTAISDSIEKRVGSVGRTMARQELKIIDPSTGETVPRGAQGEICFRGYQVMSRYYNNEKATAETIDDRRWLHSGDLGVMDDEGYVKITGRIKEMVIRGGENLYPRELEEFLRTNPKVMDVYVIGVPDIRYGEELMAWVLPRENQTVDEAEMREFCKGKIAHFKVPRYWKFVNAQADFPMTVTGKIQKFKMREQAIIELKLQDAASVKTA
ncbi:MAG: AMP-binding protein [Deltaproteobacteria bacterium HGW-Deltaproteobacteria-17]|nr:MAG: AMP-binding protein [Deltaproteobacteria bacterium HGW-Deltaproteobacteria-17]